MAPTFAFVMTNESGQIQADERKKIRQHCMRDRNKKPNSRRSVRERKREGKQVTAPMTEKAAAVVRLEEEPKTKQPEWYGRQPACMQLGRAPPSDWELMPLAGEINGDSMTLIRQYFAYNPIRDTMFPFHHFGIPFQLNGNPSWCMNLLVSEPLMVRAAVTITSACHDLAEGKPLSNTTRGHLQRTLPMLNQKLSSLKSEDEDLVLFVIGMLASTAMVFKDYRSAKAHATGIANLLRLEGEFRGGHSNEIVQLSMDRLNFSSRLQTDKWDSVYLDETRREPPSLPLDQLDHLSDSLPGTFLPNKELRQVYDVLQQTSTLLNKNYHAGTATDIAFTHQALGFAHFKLIWLEDQHLDDFCEMMRLLMIGFLAATFRLPAYEHPCCRAMSSRLLSSVLAWAELGQIIPRELMVWMIMVSGVAMVEEDEAKIRKWWVGLKGLDTWEDAVSEASKVMWIDAMHETEGQKAFARLQAGKAS